MTLILSYSFFKGTYVSSFQVIVRTQAAGVAADVGQGTAG